MPNQSPPDRNQSGATGRSRRGFAAMDASKQREIASMGGRAAHRSGNAHEFTPEEARAAGRKGGEAVSRNREHMAEIGARGGEASGQRVARTANARNAGAATRASDDTRH